MRQVIHIDPEKRLGIVQPGCVLDDLRDTAKKQGLTFGPDPETHNHNTLGGMLGNDSCGVHSLMSKNAGMGLRVADNTHELEILTYDGARFRVGPTTPEELEQIIAEGGRKGEIYAKLKAFRDNLKSRFARNFLSSNAVSLVLTFRCCCLKTASTSPPPWWAANARSSPFSKRR